MLSHFRGLCLLTFGLLAAGCGGGSVDLPPAYPVSGTVTLDGQPLADGEVTFRNAEKGVNATLSVAGGKFSGKVPDGSYRVEIRAYKDVTVKNEMYPEGVSSRENYIPKQFNDDSTLKADVASGGANQFTFEVQSSAP